MSQHIVTGPLVIAKREDGSDVYLYQDALIPDNVSADEIKRLTTLGLVGPVGGAEKAATKTGYAAQTVAELKAEIDKRNETRADDAKLPADGNKAELVASLEADDK